MNTVRTSVAVALASGVAVASLALPAGATAPLKITTANRPAAAASYLARQLTGTHHDHYVDVYGKSTFPDYGETADAVLSMDAANVAKVAADRATKYLEAHANAYMGKSPDIYPGDAAKLMLVAEAEHANPENFGGNDLVGELISDEGAGTGTAPGQFQNPGDTTYGSNVITQALAVLALANGAPFGGPDSAAVSFLESQACSDGGFQVAIRTTGDCTAKSEDVDTTAYVIQALMAADAKSDVGPALAWLGKHRNSDGGWGETPGAKSDANSTALVVEASIAVHRRALEATRWLNAQQQTCKAKVGRGAIRFQGKKYVAADDLRATSQAGVALSFKDLAEVDVDASRQQVPVIKC